MLNGVAPQTPACAPRLARLRSKKGKIQGNFMTTKRKSTNDNYSSTIAEKISNILSHVPRGSNADQKRFLQQFYQKMPVMDLDRIDPDRACALALSAYEFAGSRKKGEAKIRIYQPKKKTHGWDSEHMVVEILNDDMPFLVDSVSAELQRLQIPPLQTIHPIIHLNRDAKGALKGIAEVQDSSAVTESFMHFRLPLLPADVTPK